MCRSILRYVLAAVAALSLSGVGREVLILAQYGPVLRGYSTGSLGSRRAGEDVKDIHINRLLDKDRRVVVNALLEACLYVPGKGVVQVSDGVSDKCPLKRAEVLRGHVVMALPDGRYVVQPQATTSVIGAMPLPCVVVSFPGRILAPGEGVFCAATAVGTVVATDGTSAVRSLQCISRNVTETDILEAIGVGGRTFKIRMPVTIRGTTEVRLFRVML